MTEQNRACLYAICDGERMSRIIDSLRIVLSVC
jgi:hypothetical protein